MCSIYSFSNFEVAEVWKNCVCVYIFKKKKKQHLQLFKYQ